MKVFKIKSSRRLLSKFFQYLFVLCIIFDFRTIWIHTENYNRFARVVLLILVISTLGCILAKNYLKNTMFQSCIVAVVFLCVYCLIWFLVDPFKKNDMIKVSLQLIAIIVYCTLGEESFEDTMGIFSKIICVVAVVSLFFWLFGSNLKIIKPTGVTYTTWTGNDSLKRVTSYYGVYYETQNSYFFGLSSLPLVRNTAIFTEAPMASMVFSLAFLSEFMIQERPNIKIYYILLIAVLTTMSTTGYATVVMAVFCRYFFKKANLRITSAIKVLIVPALFTSAIFALLFLLSEKLGTSSGMIRVDDFVAGFKAWTDAPIFGNGFENNSAVRKYMSYFRANNQGFSNSVMQILAYGGLYLFAPYAVAAVAGIRGLIKKRAWLRLSFFVIFLFLFIITVCPFRMLTFYMFFSMFRQHRYRFRLILKNIKCCRPRYINNERMDRHNNRAPTDSGGSDFGSLLFTNPRSRQ